MVATKKVKARKQKSKRAKKSAPASSRGQQRRARILESATELFLNIGYGETAIDAIVDKSGGSKATLYSYFATKADLFRAVVEDVVSGSTFPDMIVEDDVRETLIAFARDRMSVVFSRRHRSLMGLIIAERGRFPDIARTYYETGPLHSHEVLRKYFVALIDQKRIVIESADEAAEFLRGMLMHQWYIDQLYMNAPAPTARKIAERAEHIVDRFLESYDYLPSSA